MELLKNAAEIIDDLIFILDENLSIIFANQYAKDKLGYTSEEITQMNALQLHPEQLRNEAVIVLKDMLEEKLKFCHLPLVNKTREMISVETKVKHITFEAKKYLFVVSKYMSEQITSFIDNSEKNRMEKDIQINEKRFQTVFNIVDVGITVTDEVGNIIDCNRASEKILGISKQEHLTRSYSSKEWRIYREDMTVMPSEEYAGVRALKEKRSVLDVVMGVEKKDLDISWISVSAIPMLIDGYGVIVSYTDITKQKNTEMELIKAKKEADKEALTKSQFLANMSHEIRTPLNGMIGILQILKMTKLDEEQMNHVKIMEKASENLMYVINEVLDYSKLEAGGYKKRNERYKLRESFLKLQNIFEASMKNDVNIFFFVSKFIAEILEADKIKIENILINLIGNAIKFTEKGEITVSAIVVNDTNSIQKLKIVVEDTGKGIRKDRLKEIFSNFVQLDESLSRKYEGTGLGLSIAKGYAKVIGGDVFVESTFGKGSKFWLEFEGRKIKDHAECKSIFDVGIIFFYPGRIADFTSRIISEYGVEIFLVFEYDELMIALECCEKERKHLCIFVEDSIIKQDGEKMKNVFSKYKTFVIGESSTLNDVKFISRRDYTQRVIERILQGKPYEEIEIMESRNVDKISFKDNIRAIVIEDNILNTYVLKRMVNIIGIECVYFEKALEAIEFLKKEHVDIILTDIQLPELSGFELINIIREFEKNRGRRIPIIAITAHSTVGFKEKCINAGADDYLAKPIKIEELINIFLKYFKTNKTKRSELFQKIEEFKRGNEIDRRTFPILFELYKESLNELKKAIIEKDNNTIIYIAHNMKGSFRVAELNEIAELYQKIEYKVENIEEEIEKIEVLAESIMRRMGGDIIESIDSR